MTDTMMKRMQALEAVAEAAEILAHSAGVIRGRTPEDADIYTHELEHIRHLMAMLSTLDALPAATPGEVVEVALGLWADAYGQTALFRADTVGDGRKAPGWTRLGTIRLALTEDGGDAG